MISQDQRGKNHSKSPKASEACERLVAQAQTHLDADEGSLFGKNTCFNASWIKSCELNFKSIQCSLA
jgi:hypothetical protein